MTRYGLFTLVALCAITAGAVPSHAAEKNGSVQLVIGMPVDGMARRHDRDLWFSGVMEQLIRFRLGADESFELVKTSTVRREVGENVRRGEVVPLTTYRTIAQRTGATHILQQNYEIARDQKSVQYYAEIIDLSDPDELTSFETDIPTGSLSAYADSIVSWIYHTLAMRRPGHLDRFYTIAPLIPDSKIQRELGRVAVGDQWLTPRGAQAAASEMIRTLDREPRNLLAQFLAAISYEAGGFHDEAAEILKDIVAILPNYKTLYVDVCRNFRLSGNYEEALSYAAAAEGKGVHSVILLAEGGKTLEAMGKYHKARRAFQSVMKIQENQIDALLFFARDANREGKPDEAIDFAQRALRTGKANGHASLALGKAYLALGKLDEASKAIARGARLLEGDRDVHFMLGEVYERLEQFRKAADQYEKALSGAAGDYELFLKIGQCWRKAGEEARALEIYRRAESQFPGKPALARAIGVLSYQTGDTAEALERLEEYTAKGHMDADALMKMGRMYTELKQYDRAFYAYNHAMPLVEDKNDCRFAMASLYVEKGDPTAAVQYLSAIITENPGYPGAYRLLGDAWFASGNYRDALLNYEQARNRTPRDPAIQSRIAHICYELNDLDRARKEYEALLGLTQDDPVAYYRLAVIALKRGNGAQADKMLSRAHRLGPPSPQIDFLLGEGFESAGRLDKAAKHYGACVARQPRNFDALLRLGAVHEKLGEPKAAAEIYVKLFAIDHDRFAGEYAQAGLLFEQANEVSRAREIYKAYLDKGYENPSINLHLARLEYRFHMHEKVIALLTAVEKQVREKPEFMLILADSYAKTDQSRHAAPWLELAYERDRTHRPTVRMLAAAYEDIGKLAQAREKYAELLDGADPVEQADVAFHIGELFERQGALDEAVGRYIDNIARYPRDLRNYEKAVGLYLAKNALNKARQVLEQAVALPGSEPRFVKKLADVCYRQNDRAKAIQYYQRFLDAEPGDFSAWFQLGSVYADKGVAHKAAEAFARATAIEPDNFEAQLAHGEALLAQNHFADAAASFAAAHTLDAAHPRALEKLNQCHRRLGAESALIEGLHKLAALRPDDFETRRELGELLIEAKQLQKGVAILEEASALRPKKAGVHIRLAGAYETMGNANARFSHLKKALAIDESNAEVHYQLGRLYRQDQRGDRAQKHFAKAVVLDTDHGAAHYSLGSIMLESGEVQHAFDLLKRAADISEFNGAYLTAFALAAHRLDKDELALQTAEQAVNIDSNHVPALSLAGMLYKEQGDYDRARSVLMRAISRDQNCAECYRALGDVWLAEEKIAKATGFYRRALEVGGYHEQTMMSLGSILALTCQDARAMAIFEEVLGRNADHYEAFYRLAHLSIRTGDHERAHDMVRARRRESKTVWHQLAIGEIKELEGDMRAARISYTVALRLLPGSPEAYAGLGRISLHHKDYSEAVVHFGKALARDPYNPYLLLDMGKAYEGIGQKRSSYEIYTEIADKYPQIAESYYRIAGLISERKKHAKAIEIIRRGMEHSPRSPRLYMALGNEHVMLGEYEEAIDAYETAFRNGGKGYVDAYLHIANIYSKNIKDEKEAKRYLRKYIKAGGQDEQAKREMARLEKNT
jgi:tetratricopeptide (TPR) repeat protein